MPVAKDVGETLHSHWSPSEIEMFVHRCGLQTADHPSRADLVERYFTGRDDGLQPWSCSRLLTAEVPPTVDTR